MSDSHEYSYTIVGFEISDLSLDEDSIWHMIHRLARECTAMVVDRPSDELRTIRQKRSRALPAGFGAIKDGTGKLGLSTNLLLLPFEEAIKKLHEASETEIHIILQPAHPLDRQSPGFIRLSKAALNSPGPTIYFPARTERHGNYIVLAGDVISREALEFAKVLSRQTGLVLDIVEDVDDTVSLRYALMTRQPSARPTLLIVDGISQRVSQSEYMKLAAVTGVPVLDFTV